MFENNKLKKSDETKKMLDKGPDRTKNMSNHLLGKQLIKIKVQSMYRVLLKDGVNYVN